MKCCDSHNHIVVVVFHRDRIRDQHKDYHAAFKAYDHKKRGYLTVADIQKLLVDLSYFLDDEQFYDLIQW